MLVLTLLISNSAISGRVPDSEVRVKLNVTATASLLIDGRIVFPINGTSLECVIFPSRRMIVHLRIEL